MAEDIIVKIAIFDRMYFMTRIPRLAIFRTKQTELLQTTDIGRNGFHLLPVQAVSDRQHGG